MTIDFRRPVREANIAFASQPLPLAMAVVVAGVMVLLPFQWITATAHHPSIGWEFVLALLLTPIRGVAELVPAARFLAMREGRPAGSVRIARVFSYRGLAGLLVSYWLRLVGWLAVSALIMMAFYLIRMMLRSLFGVPATHREPHSWTVWAGGQAILLIWTLLMSRYLLALPFLAIAEGSELNLVRESAVRSTAFRGALAVAAAISYMGTSLLYGLNVQLIRPVIPGWHPLVMLSTVAVSILASLVTTWLVLLRVGLALQVFGRVPLLR